jgi:hypothetical protein
VKLEVIEWAYEEVDDAETVSGGLEQIQQILPGPLSGGRITGD